MAHLVFIFVVLFGSTQGYAGTSGHPHLERRDDNTCLDSPVCSTLPNICASPDQSLAQKLCPKTCDLCPTSAPDSCSPTLCHNSGVCVEVLGKPVCKCPDGVTGTHCEGVSATTQTPQMTTMMKTSTTTTTQAPTTTTTTTTTQSSSAVCANNPCLNGGTCTVLTRGGFKCTCTTGNVPPFCQIGSGLSTGGAGGVSSSASGNKKDQNSSSVCGKYLGDNKHDPGSACQFQKGYCPRQVVSLTDGYDVLCDTVSDGGGWVVFQRRAAFDIDFKQNWLHYTEGFGDLTGDFWLGLDKVHRLCSKALCELRIDFRYNDVDYYAEYEDFWITGPAQNYTLNLGRYHGNAGDGMTTYHKGAPFSTDDRDNDSRKGTNCATKFGGPWWYRGHSSSSTLCYKRVSLNGRPGSTAQYTGVVYYDKTGTSKSATFTEMKLRWYSR